MWLLLKLTPIKTKTLRLLEDCLRFYQRITSYKSFSEIMGILCDMI